MSSFKRRAEALFGISSLSLTLPVAILLVYFGLRLIYFAVTISNFVPPDEVDHVGISQIYSEVYFLPDNSPKTFEYGLVTNTPYLYYWTMGRFLTLNYFGISDLLFLRLVNIPLAFATIFFVWRTLRLLTDDPLPQLLLIVAMTNTLMFSFLSASVSYDNLTNLLAAAAVYYMLAFFRTRSGDLLAASFLCQLAGCLTKVTFLPLVLILSIVLVIHEFRRLRLLPVSLKAYFHNMNRWHIGLTTGILLFLVLNVQLYGGNYFHYGSLQPEISKVLSADKAMQFRNAARNMIFTQFREGQISLDEAFRMASQIRHPGDRRDTFVVLLRYNALKNHQVELLGPLSYMGAWIRQMAGGIFGIVGHLSMFNQGPTLWFSFALMAITALSLLIRWRPRDAAWLPSCLMAIAAFYGFFLMYYVNYRAYLYNGNLEWALAGRYIFPVLGPIYVLSSYYLLQLFRNRYMRLGVFAVASVLFIAFDFPYFLLHVTPDWYVPYSP